MPDRQHRMRQVLAALNRQRGILGSTVVTRDGICILNAQPSIPTPETFSAMTAALVGAGEAALSQVDHSAVEHVEIRSGSHRIIAVGASHEILLVVLAQAGPAAGDPLPSIRSAALELKQALVVA